MRTSIATVSISGDLGEKLEAIAAAGFDGVEIFENDFLTYGASAEDVGRMVRDLGLEITLFQPFRDFEGLPEPHRTRAFERARRKFALMNQLGTDLMLVCSNVSPALARGASTGLPSISTSSASGRPRASACAIGYEALAWGQAYQRPPRRLGRSYGAPTTPNVGIILDSASIRSSRKIDVESASGLDSARQDLHRPACRRAADRHGLPAILEPALPLHARSRAICRSKDFMSAVAATGYDDYAVA